MPRTYTTKPEKQKAADDANRRIVQARQLLHDALRLAEITKDPYGVGALRVVTAALLQCDVRRP